MAHNSDMLHDLEWGPHGYLVRAVNVKLFVAGHPVTPAEREVLLRRWHQLNVIRITALGAAWLAAEHVRSRPDTR